MSAADKKPPATATETGPREPEEIRQEIEETREELGETVAAVAEKTDVKKQVHGKAEELKSQAADKAKQLGEKAKQIAPDSSGEGVEEAQRLAKENPVPLALGGAFAMGLMVGRLLWR